MESRCIRILRNATKSPVTFKTYLANLERFRKFCNVENYDDLLKIRSAKINQLIEDWIMDLKEKMSPNSIPTMYYGVELFFSMNDVTINGKKLRRMFPAKVKRSGDRPWTTEDIQEMLSVTRYRRDRAFILFLASTGARVGAMDGLKLKHVETMPNGCKSVLLYENSEEEYYAFLTPEANKAMDEYFAERKEDGERLGPESPVFRITWSRGLTDPKPLTVMGSKNIIFRAIRHARIKRVKQGRTYDIQVDMGFRKRFNTILKLNNDINSNVAEKLMAHKRGLDGVYLKPTRDQCFYEFSKAIPDLTVSSEERQKLTIIEKEKQISEFEKQQNQIDSLTKISKTLTDEVKKLSLKQEIQKQWHAQIMDWGSKNLTPDNFANLAKTDFTKYDGLEELVEHIMREHDGKFDANTKYCIRVDSDRNG